MFKFSTSFFAACLFANLGDAAAISVHFDKDVYIVNGPGETFDAIVLIDGQSTSPEDDPIAAGLFSFAVKLGFDSSKAQLTGLGDISLPASLDNFGFSTGAFLEVTPGSVGAKGNIDQNDSPLVSYGDATLSTFRFTNLASAPDSYPLSLDFFRTLGANEQFFLDGDLSVLDGDIEFGSARVLVVVPEPTDGFFLLGVLFLWISCRGRYRFRH